MQRQVLLSGTSFPSKVPLSLLLAHELLGAPSIAVLRALVSIRLAALQQCIERVRVERSQAGSLARNGECGACTDAEIRQACHGIDNIASSEVNILKQTWAFLINLEERVLT
jgi:hypothetical protein